MSVEDRPFLFFFALRDTTVVHAFPWRPHVVLGRYPTIDRFVHPTGVGGARAVTEVSTSRMPATGSRARTYETSRRVRSEDHHHHVFVLTDERGGRLFGHCTLTVGGEALTFVSRFAWVEFFKEVTYVYRTMEADEGQRLIEKVYWQRVPPSGGEFSVVLGGETVTRPMDEREGWFIDCDPALLLDVFDVDRLLRVVCALLLERHILVLGPNFSIVSKVILALQAVIHPFEWQHTMVSVTCASFLDVLAAPTPYLVGAIHAQRERIEKIPMESLVLVNIDACHICDDVAFLGADPILSLPSARTLRWKLWWLKRKPRRDAEHAKRNRNVCAAFLEYLVEVVGRVGFPDFPSRGFSEEERRGRSGAFLSAVLTSQSFQIGVEEVQRCLRDTSVPLGSFERVWLRKHPKVWAWDERRGGGREALQEAGMLPTLCCCWAR